MITDLLDLDELKERLDGDKELFLEICSVFLTDYAVHEAAIQHAISNNDAAAVKEHAHTVKGALSNLSMKKAASYALQLEIAGKEKNLNNIGPLLVLLSSEVRQLIAFSEKVKCGAVW